MIGNGAVGVRGTLEEFGCEQLAACTLAGLYDQVPGCWREPVNAPNPFLCRVWCGDTLLSPLSLQPRSHRQWIDLRHAVHWRETVFVLPDGNEVTVEAARFLSATDVHAGFADCRVKASRACRLTIEVGVDGAVWDLNGPHLSGFVASEEPDEALLLAAQAQEQGVPVAVALAWEDELSDGAVPISRATKVGEDGIFVRRQFSLRAEAVCTLRRFVNFRFGADASGAALAGARAARALGGDALFAASAARWAERWARSDVRIEGDDDAQLALRYSLYQLLIVAPEHTDRVSIPARGLSGQVYKGGVFWDTEMFMLPFFSHTQPEMARRLLRYRVHTLDGARRKAKEYGFRGAFYAWESQDTGDDACTLFNITDVFTGRPLRTYFRDRQVHISADVALAIRRYWEETGDDSLLCEGGAEVILECARFFLSCICYIPDRERYELRDVVGPDEYHERVDNNAFTSAMARETLAIARETLVWLQARQPRLREELIARLDYASDIPRLHEVHARLHVPEPDAKTGVIEQFSGYHALEAASLAEVKARVLKANEYWGAGQGIAAHTQVIKQADTVLLLHLFPERYVETVRRANWEFYEPRTEHGSSLSACIYALVAAGVGNTEWAYRYFLKTATIDLTGQAKQYVGTLYIGGTHPAANGGAWMAAVQGFGGLRLTAETIFLEPRLPTQWRALEFRFHWRGDWFDVRASHSEVRLTAAAGNAQQVEAIIAGKRCVCAPGAVVVQRINGGARHA